MNNLYKYLKSVFIITLGLVAASAMAQSNGTVSGTVLTSDGKAAEAVSVSVKELNRGTVTSENGTFTIRNVKPGTYTLRSGGVGLVFQEKQVNVTAGQNVSVAFTLSESSQKLTEVVVTGYKSANQKPVAAGKVGIKPLDNPQMVTVISSQVITDQQANRLSDVMKNVNGVALGTARGSTSETFYARGYSLGSNNIFKNGSRVSSGAMPEASTLESVEVLKGSAALLYGNVSGGAVVNLVTKQPKYEFGGEVSVRAGSYNLYKPTVDVYGPITKKLAFRVIGTGEDADSYRSDIHSERTYFNPSLLYKFNDKTSLLVQGDYLKYNNTPDFGIGSFANVNQLPTSISRSASFNTPWAYNKAKQITTSATVNHEFNKNWKLNSVVAYQNYDRNYFSTERIVWQSNGDWNRNLTRSKTDENYYNGQLNLNGSVKTGKIQHLILVGGDAENYMSSPVTFKKFNTAYDKLNVFEPEKYSGSIRTDMPVTVDSLYAKAPTYRFGLYVQDLISVSEKVKILAGLRWTYQKTARSILYDSNTDERVGYGAALGAARKDEIAADDRFDRALSPRVGIVYQPIQTTAIFASYSNNFVTNTGIDIATGGAMKPSILDQYEVGVKNDLLNGKLSANISYYKIINSDFAQAAVIDGVITSDPNLKEFSGETTSDGLEIDLSGSPVKGLNFIAGYSYNFMRYTKTSGETGSYVVGERLVNNTAHTANASVYYTFLTSRKLRGLKLGASAYYTGKRNGGWNSQWLADKSINNRLIPINGFTTVDLSAGYSFRKFSLNARLTNLTNELNYYVHENYSVNPIAPRQLVTTLSYKF